MKMILFFLVILVMPSIKNNTSPRSKKSLKDNLKRKSNDSSSDEEEWESETEYTSSSDSEIETKNKKETSNRNEFKKFISKLFPSKYSIKRAKESEESEESEESDGNSHRRVIDIYQNNARI